MAVKIRLARGGAKKRPYYRIVVADVRAPRDGDYIEKIGTYNPLLSKEDETRVTVDAERVNHWIANGALPTETVERLLRGKGLYNKPARVYKKPAPKAEAAA
jgi:small subunit ribosomal protein S16